MASHRTTIAAALSVCAAAIAVAGCGSAGSSKPDYCGKRDALTKDIQSLKDINVGSGALQELQSKLRTIQADAQDLATSAKDSFPDESAAVRTTVGNLKESVDSTSSSPSAANVALLAGNVSKVVDSISAFADATKSKC